MPKELTVTLKELFFDPRNPRLNGDFEDKDQKRMFRYLITDIGVEDLLESISASGLFNADPIIVNARQGGGYYVVEGNRRLAALKLLTGEGPDDGLPMPTVPAVSLEVTQTFSPLKVQVDWTPELLQAYLGYKHVTASREWSPEAKAKFVFEHAGGDLSEDNLRKFARTLGTRYPTLKRWLIAYLTLRQAERTNMFDPAKAPAKAYFGTFYTLLGGQQSQKFLDLQDAPLSETPVPDVRLKQLGEFLSWTIGTKEIPSAVNSRQQKAFEQVLASPKALAHFRVKRDLDSSLLYTEYNAEEIAAKFRDAAYSIEDCLSKLLDVKDSPNVREAFGELENAVRKAKYNMAETSAKAEE